jgi:hypothetical protein
MDSPLVWGEFARSAHFRWNEHGIGQRAVIVFPTSASHFGLDRSQTRTMDKNRNSSRGGNGRQAFSPHLLALLSMSPPISRGAYSYSHSLVMLHGRLAFFRPGKSSGLVAGAHKCSLAWKKY